MVAPYLKDNLFKVNLLPLESKTRKMALDARGPDDPLWILRGICELSHEAYREWIFGLSTTNPSLLNEILPDIADALEVNVVFKKSVN